MKCCRIIPEVRNCCQLIGKTDKLWLLATITLMSLIIGCATAPVSSSFDPRSINEVRFRDRPQSKHDDDVRVTVAVPSAEENKALFSANLNLKEIQSIWVKV
jgi:hypothetical protein